MIKSSNYEILGIGAPSVDLILEVSEASLKKVSATKGGMTVIDHNSLIKIIEESQTIPKMITGGSAANTIKGLANFGRKCALLGKLGQDLMGEKFLKNIKALNITSLYARSSTPTAQIICLVTPDGERTCFSFLGASQEFVGNDLTPDLFLNVKLVHIDGYTILNDSLTETAMKYAKNAGAKISFDLGSFELIEKHRERMMRLLTEYVDIIFANKDEIHVLTNLSPEKGCLFLKDLCETAVVHIGKEGCWVGNGKKIIHHPSFLAHPIDTTGAGDLFASGFLHAYLNECPLEECARYGSLVGAAAVQTLGAELSPETWNEVKRRCFGENA